jgi:hypothetical protein
MDKKQIAKIQPQKAPYVTPRIRTLKVSLSFASSAATVHDIFDLALRRLLNQTNQKPREENLWPAMFERS